MHTYNTEFSIISQTAQQEFLTCIYSYHPIQSKEQHIYRRFSMITGTVVNENGHSGFLKAVLLELLSSLTSDCCQ